MVLRLRKWAALFTVLVTVLTISNPLLADEELQQMIELFNDGNLSAAKTALESFIDQHPDNPEAKYYLGRIAFANGDLDKASDWFNKAADLDKEKSEYQLWRGRAYGRRAQNSSIFKKPFLARKTKKAFEKAVELDPESVDARWGAMQYYVLAPGIMGGSKKKARAQAGEIKKLDPVEGVLANGFILRNDKKWKEAEKVYLDGIAENPGAGTIYFTLGNMYHQNKQYDNAIEICRQAIKAIPEEKQNGYFWLGRIYADTKEYHQAFEAFETMIEVDSTDRRPYYQIGRTAALSGENLDRGEQCLKQFLTHESHPNKYWQSWAHYRLGMIFENKGERPLALAEYNTALELDPDHKEAKKARKKLN